MQHYNRNVVANYIGTAWNAVFTIILVPVFIKLLGPESFGLIGLFTTLQAAFALLDMGMSTTLNRELSRLSIQPNSEQQMRNLVRTLEIIYWALAAVIAILGCLAAPFIANQWLNTTALSKTVVQQAILMMSIAISIQFPFALYSGGLMGIEKQVTLNGIKIIGTTLRIGGAIAVLYFVSRTVELYFAWQIFGFVIQTGLSALVLWRSLPRSSQSSRFTPPLFRQIWKFAAGMMGITLLSTLLTQMDKVVLSKLLPLKDFGYYSLAGTLASSLLFFMSPIFTATFPQLSRLVSLDDEHQLIQFYHKSCQLMSFVLIPTTVILVLFAPEVLLVWTRSPEITANVHLIASLLVAGTALNGLMSVPYALMLAHGWTRLTLLVNAAAVVIFLPSLLWLTSLFGAVGAAIVWVLINGSYIIISIQLMHRRLLKTETWVWYTKDVGMPLLASLIVAMLGRFLLPKNLGAGATLVFVISFAILTQFAAALSTPLPRSWLRQTITILKTKWLQAQRAILVK